jgi:hypothetical protein
MDQFTDSASANQVSLLFTIYTVHVPYMLRQFLAKKNWEAWPLHWKSRTREFFQIFVAVMTGHAPVRPTIHQNMYGKIRSGTDGTASTTPGQDKGSGFLRALWDYDICKVRPFGRPELINPLRLAFYSTVHVPPNWAEMPGKQLTRIANKKGLRISPSPCRTQYQTCAIAAIGTS